jgi:hypothetical protein
MRHIAKIGVLVCSFVFPAATAVAGPYADDLAKCLVKSSSDEDQIALMKWMFVAIAQHPAVHPLSNISDSERTDVNAKGGALFERLITKDCRAESVAALKYEGTSSIESSFSTLGQIAVGGLMKDPAVQKELAQLADSMDSDKLNAVLKEAGVTNDSDAPSTKK